MKDNGDSELPHVELPSSCPLVRTGYNRQKMRISEARRPGLGHPRPRAAQGGRMVSNISWCGTKVL